MILELFNQDKHTIETDELTVKEHAITTKDDVIQIANISMMTRATLKFRITLAEIIIVLVFITMFWLDFIPQWVPFCFLMVYVFVTWGARTAI